MILDVAVPNQNLKIHPRFPNLGAMKDGFAFDFRRAFRKRPTVSSGGESGTSSSWRERRVNRAFGLLKKGDALRVG
jgi:hypothetical protein